MESQLTKTNGVPKVPKGWCYRDAVFESILFLLFDFGCFGCPTCLVLFPLHCVISGVVMLVGEFARFVLQSN